MEGNRIPSNCLSLWGLRDDDKNGYVGLWRDGRRKGASDLFSNPSEATGYCKNVLEWYPMKVCRNDAFVVLPKESGERSKDSWYGMAKGNGNRVLQLRQDLFYNRP